MVEAEHVTKAYGDKVILKDISLLVERGSKVAFVGQNGQGKSTFMKAIVNEFEYEGTIKLGHNVQFQLLAQNQAEYLDGRKNFVRYHVRSCNPIRIVQKCAICWEPCFYSVAMK